MNFFLFFCLFLFIVNAVCGKPTEKVCEVGSQWKEECNSCFCNQDGTAKICTRMMCFKLKDLKTSTPPTTKVCEPNARWKQECNDCWCNAEGTAAACTRKACLPEDLTTSAPIAKKECEPNARWKNKCNDCWCNAEGTAAACTLKGCEEPHIMEIVKETKAA